jgi:hypothetical protein
MGLNEQQWCDLVLIAVSAVWRLGCLAFERVKSVKFVIEKERMIGTGIVYG